jgi:hypothetical protein
MTKTEAVWHHYGQYYMERLDGAFTGWTWTTEPGMLQQVDWHPQKGYRLHRDLKVINRNVVEEEPATEVVVKEAVVIALEGALLAA